jgi:hypothetical protein
MKSSNFWARALAFVAVGLLAASGAFAQLQSGNLYGTVVDEQGAALPGVTLTLTGAGAPNVQVTDAQGRFRFLGLSPSTYLLQAELEGFSRIEYPNIVINVGRNTEIQVTLASAVEDVITVTAESPLLDERRISTGATVSQTELEKIPTARDPWAVLQSTPGVLTDRINVGGNESGQQSQYVGPGSGGEQAVWSVDGVVITDMAALGSSPAYYDFDSFEEMQVSTGGSDATLATPGVSLNMVTKRGTNEWRGSGRYLVADESWQSDLDFSRDDLGNAIPGTGTPNQTAFSQGNRIVEVTDYGAELGGPIVRDRLWVWGSYALNEIDLLTISDVSDFTELETMNLKLNAQVATSNSATFFAMQSDKVKIGRNAGPTRPQPTTWNQSKFGDDPTTWKLEDTHIFSSNFYLTGMYSVVNGGFQLAPQGGFELGAGQLNSQLDEDFVWQQSFLLYQTPRPQEQFKGDGSTFFNTGSLSHELKFGAGYRVAEVASLTRWPGFGLELNFYQSFGYEFNVIGLTRDAFAAYEQVYTSFYAQDTLTMGNLTANIGLRYDLQEGENLARTVVANPVFPNLMPAVSYPGADYGFEWETITPRLGLTYALGESRKTLLRASYSQFADQLGADPGVFTNPLYGASYAYYYYDDRNGNGRVEPSEVLGSDSLNNAFFFSGNVNPLTGGLLISDRVDPNLDAPLTHELLFGVEHALLPEFVIGLNLTFRQIEDVINEELLVFDGDAYAAGNLNSVGRRVRRDDFVVVRTDTVRLPDRTVSLPIWGLREGVSSRGGFDYYNSGIEQEYVGAALTFNKRLANRWMLRGNLSWQDWTWNVPDGELIDPMQTLGDPRDGQQVVQGSGTGSGAKGNVFINSNWSYSVNGLYQIAPDRPWGFNVAANLTGREGYPEIYFRRTSRTGVPGLTSFQVTGPDDLRNPDVHVVDLRVEKEFTFSEFGLTVGADLFNALNESYVLQRRGQSAVGNTGHVVEILSPRIFRLGARLSFR